MKQLMAVVIIFSVGGCDAQFEKIPEDRFIGEWELSGRSMFDGIKVEIQREEGKLLGRISKLNDNKYVTMFCEIDDVGVSGVTRVRTTNFA